MLNRRPYRGGMARALTLLVALAVLLPAKASASPFIRYGIQDDAWLMYGPGPLANRLDRLTAMGTDVVRVTVNWNVVEPTRGTDNWGRYDELLQGLHARGIAPLVTLWGTPGWANGRHGPNWAPTSP